MATKKEEEKTIKVLAEYPFIESAEGATQTLWGVDFVHEVVKQGGEEFHILTATLPHEVAQEMANCGRVSKA